MAAFVSDGIPPKPGRGVLFCTNSVTESVPGGNMATIRKTITLTDLQDQWIKARIAAGHFTSDSEYIRDLIRHDRERRVDFELLQAAVQEGIDSGSSEKTVPSIMEEVEVRLRSDGRL